MHSYRSHSCNDLRKEDAGQKARLSGWIHRVRDMGGIVFIDLRDHYGITQVVVNPQEDFHMDVHHWKLESVITVTGDVVLRDKETFNKKLPTGEVELTAKELKMESLVESMPFNVALEMEMPEAMRLEHRYLDLRTSRMHHNIITRAKIIAGLRQRMTKLGFNEFQTPILTASSPEGARDFLVPSRLNPGKFYALPQAPQQFKQLLMVSGFDKYFQIAPCFRDEDARADRSPGEFYQLDMEMSFATQDDVFKIIEDVIIGTFQDFTQWTTTETEFVRIPYKESMLKYGSDKPDLRNPIIISDISSAFVDSEFTAFASVVKNGGVVRAMKVAGHSGASRKFHDKMIKFAQSVGSKGLGYLIFENGELRSPIAKFLSEETIQSIKDACDVEDGDVVYFVADKEKSACRICAAVRDELGLRLKLLDEKEFKFCWIVDYPMFEYNDDTKKVEFSHNPFSMPQGEMEALETMDPLEILAWQYDLVCNGIELSSGAVRNHRPDIMLKAFGIAGYSAEEVESSFSGMINAFRHGAPPHAGIAPGVDRMVMLILGEPSIREIIAFPLNGSAQDLLMNAPSPVSQDQLKELHLKLNLPKPKPKMQG
ncbi:aspartate--tRNA ligase [Lentisphaera profundi]|uniref:Aspartate--tRNA ligase n=1 Tax=Lentisphaera profundi TaxID=1658616 RepID=A0ABY7VWB5_9BACT|nr:aspartate--tRNA ligase [Lentisphaera profundi]WDE98526.1 aspartate--tRNA ligase [Lentisphaera profundi]